MHTLNFIKAKQKQKKAIKDKIKMNTQYSIG